MGWVALGCYALYLAIAFGLRTAIQIRRTGSSGFKGLVGAPGLLGRAAGVLVVLALGGGVAAPVLEIADALEPVGALDGTGGHIAGLILVALGIGFTFHAQLAMGASWRIGVDASERTELVTDGPFARVRNPIFSSMLVTGLGLVLLVPNVVALAGFAALLVALEVQVRLVEEPYLRQVHGDDFAAYTTRAGRFLPLVGRRPA